MAFVTPSPSHPQLKDAYNKLVSIGDPNGLDTILIPLWGRLLIQICWLLLKYNASRSDRVLGVPDDISITL